MHKTITQNNFGTTLIRFLSLGLIAIAGSVFAAGPSAIEGTVKDPNGKPISGADVRIEAKSGSVWTKVTQTDAKGHYSYNGLPVGTYRVSLVVNSAVKASINNVTTKLGDPTKLNFDLKTTKGSAATASAKKAKHYVYVPAETGSNMGGRWVEVDDNGDATTAGADRVEKLGKNALNRMQSNSGAIRGGGGN